MNAEEVPPRVVIKKEELFDEEQVETLFNRFSGYHECYDAVEEEGELSFENDFTVEQYGSTCAACNLQLSVPWVRCLKCNPRIDLCSQCFSFGTELDSGHENDHPYTVVNFAFPLFEAGWTAADEMKLLEAIQEFGLGNWQTVSQRLMTKSAAECERHYFQCYVENPHAALPHFPDNHHVHGGAPVIFKLSDHPPRPPEGSSMWLELAGYSPARNEFAIEHDNFVEMDVAHLNNDRESPPDQIDLEAGSLKEKKIFRDLKLAVVDVYRNCLKERQRRKKIIRDYGLITMRLSSAQAWRRYEMEFSSTAFRPFMKLFPPETFQSFLESLSYERLLKANISKLKEYRNHGIKQLHSVRWYRVMKQRRDAARHQRSLLSGVLNHIKDENSCKAWLAKQAVLGNSKAPDAPLPSLVRKAAPPLHIEEMPGYEKLNKEERELCASVRLVPQAYLKFSKILTTECQKQGFLRLAHARPLIKIDVNKTRKLYDFLVLQGFINKDPI